MKTDSTKKFIPVNVAVLTISDTRNESNDTSGNILVNKVKELGHTVVSKKILKDDKELIDQKKALCKRDCLEKPEKKFPRLSFQALL